jgi:Stress responsive A/B Barrel Domain
LALTVTKSRPVIQSEEVPMIYHAVRMSFKPDISAEQREDGLERLRTMGREIEVVESWCVGRDVGGDFEYGAIYALSDIEAYKVYMNHPVHLDTDAAGLPLVSNFVSLDITDDEDPEIADKIAEVHRTRYENRPDILELVGNLDSYTGAGVPDGSTASK